MALACPFCGQEIVIQDPKPGRFRMTCPSCRAPFALKVGDAPDFVLSAGPLPAPMPTPEVTAPVEVATQASLEGLGARLKKALTDRLGWGLKAVTQRGAMIGGALSLVDLGRTSRGTVSKGRQVLLGRDVTIRLMPADWGGADVNSLANSEREAYVSASILHPNILRRLDFGHEAKRRFAMDEPVEGKTLATLATQPDFPGGDAALPLILQAARGLNAGHAQGLPHGDPSGENLWLDRGVVKLAGLGLAGPELPGRESAEVNARYVAKDAQTLGQTLDFLARRATPNVNPPSGVAGVVASKLKAAGTADGYRDLPEAIRAIETILNLKPGGGFIPTQDEESRLVNAAEAYHNTPLGGLRAKLAAGFVVVGLLFALIFAKTGAFALMGSVLGLLFLTATYYALIRAGVESRSGLFGRVRELLLGGRRADWVFLIAIKVIALVALYFLGWLVGAIVLAIFSLAFAIAFLVAFDLPTLAYREGPLGDARKLLGDLRSRGVSEYAIRDFVRDHAGPRWEELFEALFGLDETRLARSLVTHDHKTKLRLDAWRFPIIDWVDRRLWTRREAVARERFARVEEVAAVARKMNDMTARRRSKRIADALLVVAREVREVSLAARRPGGEAIRVTPRPIPDLLKEAVETPEKLLTDTEADTGEPKQNLVISLLATCFGPRVRFLLGGTLLAGFLLWADQVEVISGQEIRDKAEAAIKNQDANVLKDVNVNIGRARDASEPLVLPGVPREWTAQIAGYGVGAAGLILVLSAFTAGSKIALFAVPGAAIAWFGARLGLPGVGPIEPAALASAIGGALFIVGLVLTRR